jgi:hypothetical protein
MESRLKNNQNSGVKDPIKQKNEHTNSTVAQELLLSEYRTMTLNITDRQLKEQNTIIKLSKRSVKK